MIIPYAHALTAKTVEEKAGGDELKISMKMLYVLLRDGIIYMQEKL